MKADVTHFNAKLGYYSAVTENRKKAVFTLIELGDIQLNDTLVGEIESRGIKLVENQTRHIMLKIDIKEIHDIDTPFCGHS
jgi:hypothetical protein